VTGLYYELANDDDPKRRRAGTNVSAFVKYGKNTLHVTWDTSTLLTILFDLERPGHSF